MARDKVFISYSHRDRRSLDELLTHLKPLADRGKLALWSDDQISPGAQWRAAIEVALDQTKVAVMLVSPEFLASRFVSEVEVPKLLKSAESESVTILCLYIAHCVVDAVDYAGVNLASFQGLNSPERPVVAMSRPERQRTLRDAAVRILDAANLVEKSKQTTTNPPMVSSGAVQRFSASPNSRSDAGMDRYSIIRKLSTAPYGEVYKCRMADTGELCVVKCTRSSMVSMTAQRALLRIEQPSIATARRIWQEGDSVFEELPYVGGTRLSDAIPRGIGGLRGILLPTFYEQIGEVLRALHKEGLIHRDIHPENIFLTLKGVSNPDDGPPFSYPIGTIGVRPSEKAMFAGSDREAYFSDLLRLTFVLVDNTFVTHVSDGANMQPVMHGAYTPTEQALGAPTFASDYYALGATLFYSVTGTELPSQRERISDSVTCYPVLDGLGYSGFDKMLEGLLRCNPSARRFEPPLCLHTLLASDCGTLELRDGTFLIGNSFSTHCRCLSRAAALKFHIAAENSCREWLTEKTHTRERREVYERLLEEHIFWSSRLAQT